MSIRIIKPGIFTTIQDLGRTKYRSFGIGPGGAMDLFAATVANYIAGNNEDVPLIEMHFPAAEILFETDSLVCITGANFNACINDIPVETYKPLPVNKASVLSFKKNIAGARVYLAIHGGMEAEQWLGSYSTNIKVKAGGHEGGPLKKEDVILIPQQPIITGNNFSINSIDAVYNNQHTIRCTEGPEWGSIDDLAKEAFLKNDFSITSQSDRMGYRLAGENILLQDTLSLVSSPVNYGTVQLLPNGQLIILMADHQTTGGYPRLANVISADLPKLAQLPINATLHFQFVSLQEAEDALISLRHCIAVIKTTSQKFYGIH